MFSLKELFGLKKKAAAPTPLAYDKSKTLFLVMYNEQGIPCPHCLPVFEAFSVEDCAIPMRNKMRVVYQESGDPRLYAGDAIARKAGAKFGLNGLAFPSIIANGNLFVGTNTFDGNRGFLAQVMKER